MSICLLKHIKNTVIMLVFLTTISCDKKPSDINNIVKIERFENLFYNSDEQGLSELKELYPYFFPNEFDDKVWNDRLKDSIQLEIYGEIKNKYKNVSLIERDLYYFFQKQKILNKNFVEPKVITLNTDVDYRNRVILADTLLLLGLDNYLGPNHPFYEGIPIYIKEDLGTENILPDIAEQFAYTLIPRHQFYTFLDKIIYHGKILAYKDFSLNKFNDRLKIGYSKNKMKWAKDNEYFVWTYFIENDILFNPSNNLNSRFISDAPFSVFYLEIDQESSEMVGRYIGWQIVKSYLKNNDVTLAEMLRTEPIEIYNNSRYKPKR